MNEKMYNYKITIFGTNVYQEILLRDAFQSGVVIGTTSAAKIRFNREDFFLIFKLMYSYKKQINLMKMVRKNIGGMLAVVVIFTFNQEMFLSYI